MSKNNPLMKIVDKFSTVEACVEIDGEEIDVIFNVPTGDDATELQSFFMDRFGNLKEDDDEEVTDAMLNFFSDFAPYAQKCMKDAENLTVGQVEIILKAIGLKKLTNVIHDLTGLALEATSLSIDS